MFSSSYVHAPIIAAIAGSSNGSPLKIRADSRVGGVLQGSADIDFFMGDRPEDNTLARALADNINAVIADHKRTLRVSTMMPAGAGRAKVWFEDISIPDLSGCVSFALVVEFTDLENWIAVDVLSGSGAPDTWTTVGSVDLRNAFFAYAERPECHDDILDAIRAEMAENHERMLCDKADLKRDEDIAERRNGGMRRAA